MGARPLRVEWQDGLIKRFVQSGITGFDWGPETADRGSFFSLTEKAANCRIEAQSGTALPNGHVRRVEVAMSEGRWIMDIETVRHAGRIRITQRLRCLERSVFQDFVIRFKFTQSSFTSGRINKSTVRHENRNIWHQHEVTEASLLGASATVRLNARGIDAGKFRVCMYLRDEPGSWIAHARLIPVEPCDLYWIRWANRFGTLSLSDAWSRRVLRRRWLKRKLWHLSERRGGRPALQAQGLAVLGPGECFGLQAECEITPRTGDEDDCRRRR
jgi:hypothetical protein